MSLIKLLLFLSINSLAKASIIAPSEPPSNQPNDITNLLVETSNQSSQKVDLDFSNPIASTEAQDQSKISSSSLILPQPPTPKTPNSQGQSKISSSSPIPPQPPTPKTPNFCERTIARTSCPKPQTINHLNLKAYMGIWYQTMVTARYKLTFQPGLICEQTNYTLLSSNIGGAPRLAAAYSGSAILPRLEAAALRRLSQSTDRICTAAKNVCQLTTRPYSGLRQDLRALWHSITPLTFTHPSIAAELQLQIRRTFHLIRLVECGMDSLSTNVSQIQQAYGYISSGQGRPRENIRQLTEIITGTLGVVRDVSYQISSRDYIRRQIIDAAVKLVATMPSLARQISGTALQIASEFAKIETSLAEIGYVLTNLEVGSPSLRGLATFGKGFKAVWHGSGFQNHSAPGKFEMDLYGAKSPYWIIGLEGSSSEGYKAALVYSCTEGFNQRISENLFVLSRSGVVEEETMGRFMEIATLYEIDVDCNNPFLWTDQRAGSCRAP